MFDDRPPQFDQTAGPQAASNGTDDGSFAVIHLSDRRTVTTPLAKALLDHKDDPDAWVFVPMTDWKSPEAVSIREEIRDITGGEWVVQFRGWSNNGVRGTRMHLQTYEEFKAESTNRY